MFYMTATSGQKKFDCTVRCATTLNTLPPPIGSADEWYLGGYDTQELAMVAKTRDDNVGQNICFMTDLSIDHDGETCQITKPSDTYVLHKRSGVDHTRCGARCAQIKGKTLLNVKLYPGSPDQHVTLTSTANTVCYITGAQTLVSGGTFHDPGYCDIWADGATWRLHFQSNDNKSVCEVECVSLT